MQVRVDHVLSPRCPLEPVPVDNITIHNADAIIPTEVVEPLGVPEIER